MKKKVKALFQIVIIIFSIFTISLLAEPVSASEVCCEKTTDGRYCVNTDQSNCDSSGSINQISCEQTSFCQLGCCFDNTENIFNKNVPMSICTGAQQENPNLQFNLGDTDCNQALSSYPRGCCMIANECSYTTNENCKQLGFEQSAEIEFQEGGSELECVNQCRQQEEGCCVTQGGCTYSTRGECISSEESTAEFNLNQYCSSFDSCFCKPKDHQECFDGDIYWFDSCGNKEDLVKECPYEEGIKCGEVDGKLECKSLDCKIVPDDNNDLSFFPDGIAKNGESWCIYDSATGPSFDVVGARHYRHVCVEGEIIAEPCEDFRREICVQGNVKISTPTGEDSFREATCRENRWQDCMTECNQATPPTAVEDENQANTEEARYKRELQEDKECCENKDLRDCVWASEGESDYGVCVPLVSPGFQFWSDTSDSRTTPTTGTSDSDCSVANKECITKWRKIDLMVFESDWQCLENGNCECYGDDWLESTAMYCRSAGDCGAHYNYVGKYSDEGYTRSWQGETPQTGDLEEKIRSKIQGLPPKSTFPQSLAGSFEEKFQNAKEGLDLGDLYIQPNVLGGPLGYILVGIGAWMATAYFISSITSVTYTGAMGGPVGAAIAAVIVLVIIVLAVMHKYEDRIVNTDCSLWQAPSGGSDCSVCDEDSLKPCSEYRCKSLGQLCTFIRENEGTDRPTCVSQNPNDANSPIITPWPENLTEPYNIETESNGFEITPSIGAYEEITVGIKTNEPAQCKIDDEIKDYDTMLNYYGDQYYSVEHSMTLNLDPGQEIIYYIKCQDNAGNQNTVPYAIKLKTKSGPDLTPPVIEGSDLTNTYIPAHLSTKITTIYINEPVTCKYSNVNEDFTQMQNEMTCSVSTTNQFMSNYKCTAPLPIEKGENTYYFKCKDNNENTNSDPFSLTLIGTEPLNITETGPTGDLYYSDVTLKVTTKEGAEQGKATCSYNGITFLNTNQTQHTQQLNLTKGDYVYNILCEDIAGNIGEDLIYFSVKRDETFSEIYYVYKDSSSIYVVLDEPTTCKYSDENFDYEDGIDMTGQDKEHSMPLGLEQYYVICEDVFGNTMPVIKIYP